MDCVDDIAIWISTSLPLFLFLFIAFKESNPLPGGIDLMKSIVAVTGVELFPTNVGWVCKRCPGPVLEGCTPAGISVLPGR